MNTNSSYTPSQDFLDKAIKDAWYTFLLAEFTRQKQKNPLKGEIEQFASAYSDNTAFTVFSQSRPYTELPPSCRNQGRVIPILRNATWS